MDKPVAAAPTGAKEKVEKQARQLAYDVRYKTKQSLAQKSGGKMDPAQVQKAYMSQLSKSPAPPAVKARAKQMLLGEDYKSDLGKLVSDSAATALYKVFVEHHQKDENGNVIEHGDGTPSSVEEITEEEKTYKVRVTDKKSNNSYVRMATRAKIGELRANPNIASVEMTEYGSPTKSEKYKGKQTAAAKAGKDYDGDGKVESPTAEYKGSKDKAIKKAIATRKEEYSWRDGFAELIEKNDKEKKITGEGVNNKKLIKVFPDEVKEMYGTAAGTGATNAKPAPKPDPQMASKEKKQALLKKQVLLKKLQAVRAGAGSDITSSYEPEKKLTEGEDVPCDPKPETPEGMGDITFDAGGAIPTTIKAIGDPREIETAIKLKKTQLRASGLNCSHEPEGELVETIRGGFAWSTAAATIMVIVGLTMAIYASEHLIDSVLRLGESLNLDQGAMGAIMGTSVSAVGTSLPELTVALLCVRKSQGVAIGALIGSNITDPLLSVGIAAMIHPLAISQGAYFVTTAIIMPMTILGIITCTLLMWTDFKFNRTEGVMMIIYYLIFLSALILDQLGKLPF